MTSERRQITVLSAAVLIEDAATLPLLAVLTSRFQSTTEVFTPRPRNSLPTIDFEPAPDAAIVFP